MLLAFVLTPPSCRLHTAHWLNVGPGVVHCADRQPDLATRLALLCGFIDKVGAGPHDVKMGKLRCLERIHSSKIRRNCYSPRHYTRSRNLYIYTGQLQYEDCMIFEPQHSPAQYIRCFTNRCLHLKKGSFRVPPS